MHTSAVDRKEYGLCAYKGDNSLNDARARGLLSSMNQT